MNRFSMLERAWDYIYGTFRIRTWLRLMLVVLSVALGPFLFFLPFQVRFFLVYVYAGVFSATGFFTYGAFKGPVKSLIGSILLGRRYRAREFTPGEYTALGFQQIMNEMGIKKRVRVYVTSNPWIEGPFTNAFTNKVYLPTSWLAEYHPWDLRGVLGHELGHVKTKGKFVRDILVGAVGVVGLTFVLSVFSILAVSEIFEFALVFLMLTVVSWRNEFMADMEGAKVTGPEALISVFDQLRAKSKRDEGSETHPPLRDRIARLSVLLTWESPVGFRVQQQASEALGL